MLDADVNTAEMLENQGILLSSDGLIDESS